VDAHLFWRTKILAQRSPESLEASGDELFATCGLPGDKLHRGFLQRHHGGRRETGRQVAQYRAAAGTAPSTNPATQ